MWEQSDFGFLQNNYLKSGDQSAEGKAEIEDPIFDRISVFPQPTSRALRDPTHVVEVNCIL